MYIKEEENKIFNKIKLVTPGAVEDGVVNEEEYLSSSCRILYIMKEVNSGFGWDLKDFLDKGGRPQTWDNIARWTEGILNIEKEYSWEYLIKNNENRRMIYLKKIGVINLKKVPGNHTSIPKEISLAAINNRNIIKQQINLYKPDIIICCGTAKDFIKCYFESKNIKWNMTKRGVKYIKVDDKVIINFAHPEARIRCAYLYYALVDAVREIMTLH